MAAVRWSDSAEFWLRVATREVWEEETWRDATAIHACGAPPYAWQSPLDGEAALLEPAAAAALGAIAYGAGDFLGGCAARRIAAFHVVAIAQIVALIFMFQHFALDDTALPRGNEMMIAMVAGAAYAAGLALLYHGFAFGRIAIVAPLCCLVGIAVPLVGDVALGREITTPQFVGILLCASAIYLIAGKGPPDPASGRASWSVRFGIFSGVGYGLADLCLGTMPVETSTGALLVARSVAAVVAVGLVFAMVVRLVATRPMRMIGVEPAVAAGPSFARQHLPGVALPALTGSVILATGAGVFDIAGHIGYVHAATRGSMGVAASLGALFPAVTVLLAVIVLKERVSPAQLAGFTIAGVGVVVLLA